MDDKWFKAQQKRAGVTSFDLGALIGRDRTAVSRILNGHQKMTLDQARAFAAALGVDLPEMLRRAGLADAPVARTLAPGFSESDAAPWIAADTDTGRAIARALGADRPGIDVWEVRSLAMGLQGYLPGDHILVDTHQAERVKAGDVVIAQIYDHARALAYTVMRRWEPPVLVAASADPADRRVHVVDGVNAVIRGRVCACWRQAA